MKNKSFTLIELIVVITILAILGTIAFIGFKGYTGDARNSKITTDISNLHNSLAILKATEGSVPMPDSPVVLKAGTLDITYEGEVGDTVRSALKASKDMKNPFGDNYKYAVNGTQKDFTLVANLEDDTASLSTKAFAEDEPKTMLFKGEDVLTAFDGNNKFIGGDVNAAISSISKAYLGGEEMTIVSNEIQQIPEGIKFNRGLTFNSCKQVLEAGWSRGDDFYTLYYNGKLRQLYCDMTTDGGGWTRVSYNLGDSSGNIEKDMFVMDLNADHIGGNEANTAVSINVEKFSKDVNTNDAMLKSSNYSSAPIIDNGTGNWDYDKKDCIGNLGHTSRTEGCDNHWGNDNYNSEDKYNIAIYGATWPQASIVPYYLVDHKLELCRSNSKFCDFEFYLR